LLADKLIDLHTANLIMDELIDHVDACKRLPSFGFINIVYQCTPAGSPLRKLFRDLYIHEADYDWFQKKLEIGWSPPVEFANDLIVEIGRLHGENRNRAVRKVFEINAVDLPRGRYHQSLASCQGNNGT
jgi:hypothetical protein